MRSREVADRAGKQADGSAKTREAKLVTIWTAESRDEQGKPVRDPGSVTYSAAIESAATLDTSPDLSDFAARVQREASRRGFTEAPRQVVLGDGSTWIWNTTAELFPQATQILDRFHAKEHLSQVGKAVYGDSPEGQSWIQARYDELDEGRLKSLVQALHGHAKACQEAREWIHYIWKNRRRMRYPDLHQQGFCTSTGVVEAGCNAECIVTQSLSPACSPVNHFEGFLVGIKLAARSDAISLSVALKRPERSFGGTTDSRASRSSQRLLVVSRCQPRRRA